MDAFSHQACLLRGGQSCLSLAVQRSREHGQPRAGVDQWLLTGGMNDEAA